LPSEQKPHWDKIIICIALWRKVQLCIFSCWESAQTVRNKASNSSHASGNNSDLYAGGVWFESQSWHRLTFLWTFVISVTHSRCVFGNNLK
jgi:hypothetical protein